MATNLETLELTIQSNAQSAKKGIDDLITSLSGLPASIRSSVGELTKLNAQLERTRKLTNKIKFPFFNTPGSPLPTQPTPGGGGSRNPKVSQPGVAIPPQQAIDMVNSAKRSDLMYMKAQGMMASFVGNAAAGSLTQQQLAEQAMKIQDVTRNYQNLKQAENEQLGLLGRLKEGFQNAAKNAEKYGQRISKMASTMIMRTALKALIKNFSEAWEAAYNFSKKIGGDFAANVDKVRGALGNMATNIIRAFSPIMNIIAPIFSVMATGINYLANAIQSLLKMLGIAASLLGQTAEEIGATGDASKKAAKDVIAGFDELNVLNSNSGDGGGGGGGSKFSTKFQEEIDAIKIIVAESMLAVGLILAFSGHVGIGLALAAVGAATIAGTIIEKWGTLPSQVKNEIVTIMAIAGGAMMAIGLVLALSGAKTALGIALIAAGAANMVAAVALSWNLDNTIKGKMAVITSIVGTSLLGIGAIVAFSGGNLPLGIGLMIAGAASLAASVALSWNLDETVKKKITTLTTVVGGALLVVGAVLAFSGANIPLGIGLMAAGGVSLAASIALNWDSLKTTIINTFKTIKDKISEAWTSIKNAIGAAWDKYMTWTGIKWSDIQGAWSKIKEGITGVWTSVKISVSEAWERVKNWISTKWKDYGGWEGIKNGLSNVWNNIKTSVSDAWNKVTSWISSKWADYGGWQGIQNGLKNAWGNVKTAVSDAWEKVKDWIQAQWSDFKAKWEGIKSGLVEQWDNIKTSISNAWDKYMSWTGVKWSDISSAWTNIKTQMSNLWNNIGDAVSNAWTNVKTWLDEKWQSFSNWNGIRDQIRNRWKEVKNAVTEAWDSVKSWIDEKWTSFKNWDSIRDQITFRWTEIKNAIQGAWDSVSKWWDKTANGAVYLIESAWVNLSTWFYNNVTKPIEDAFKNAINWCIYYINLAIGALNSVGNFTIPGLNIGGWQVWEDTVVSLFRIPYIDYLAEGRYDIQKGQLFIANEAGAEMVGSMNGHTTVANQEQIIEGIRRGVSDANNEQNVLLRRQNEILLGILQKEGTVKFGASIGLGRVARQSIEMYETATGV